MGFADKVKGSYEKIIGQYSKQANAVFEDLTNEKVVNAKKRKQEQVIEDVTR